MSATSSKPLPPKGFTISNPRAEAVILPDQGTLVAALAERLETAAREAIAARGQFLVALSGGHTPEALYQLLAGPDWRDRFDWVRFHVFFGDERAVAPDDARSNYRSARLGLLEKVPIPAQQVHRWLSEADDLDIAAREYAAQLAAHGGRLDVTLLGLGEDGHIASLFPGSAQLRERTQSAVATDVSPTEPHLKRLTLTLPALCASREVWFLAVGAGKSEPVRASFQEPVDSEVRPSQGIVLGSGVPLWFLDAAAGKLLT